MGGRREPRRDRGIAAQPRAAFGRAVRRDDRARAARRRRLVEIDFGDGEGLTPAELAERFPAEWAAFCRAPASNPFPGGERGRDGIARALPVFDELVEEFPDGRVLIVAHATLIRLLFCELAGMDPDGYRDLLPVLGNCSITTIVYPWATESELTSHPRIRLLGFDVPPGRAAI